MILQTRAKFFKRRKLITPLEFKFDLLFLTVSLKKLFRLLTHHRFSLSSFQRSVRIGMGMSDGERSGQKSNLDPGLSILKVLWLQVSFFCLIHANERKVWRRHMTQCILWVLHNTDTGHRENNKSYYYKIMMSSSYGAQEKTLRAMFTNFFSFFPDASLDSSSVNSGSNDCWLKVKDRIMVITEKYLMKTKKKRIRRRRTTRWKKLNHVRVENHNFWQMKHAFFLDHQALASSAKQALLLRESINK